MISRKSSSKSLNKRSKSSSKSSERKSEKKLNGKTFTEKDLIEILGEKLFYGAIQGANQIFKHVDESAKEIPLAFANFRSTAKKLFPKEKFIQIESVSETK